MPRRVETFDWSKTPLGPVESWSPSLRTAVRLILRSRYPMFVWWGRELTNIYNDAYVPILGPRHPDALGRSGADVWREIWPVLGPQVEGVLREGRATWNESLLLLMDRYGFTEETYFTFSYSPAPDDDGGVGGMFCACTEDTRRVLGERRLRTLRDLGERSLTEARTIEQACHAAAVTLAENAHDFPFALLYLFDDEHGNATLVETVRLTPPHDAAPATVAENGDDPWDFASIRNGGAAHVVEHLEARFGRLPAGPWTDDTTRCAFVQPLSRSGGRDAPAGVLVAGLSPRLIFDDDYRSFMELAAAQIATAISHANTYQEERRRAEALAALDHAKTEFFSNVSHEFRTPLTLMLGPLEESLEERGAPLPAGHRERLETAHRSSLRLLKLVNTLLDFSRIEAGRSQARYEPTDLSRLTTDLASVFRSAITSAGLRLVVDCPPLSHRVYVDREMWEKVVLNLVSNAFKFTFEGTIEVSLHEEGEHVALQVRDTGTGIPDAEVPRVFERFHRVRGARGRTHEGTGIGLSLVQELVRLHGGAVDVESALGRGSTFTVTIPFGRAHLPPDRVVDTAHPEAVSPSARAWSVETERWVEPPAPATASPTRSERARIVLADDNADMRDYLRRLLEQRGYEVILAGDGMAAEKAVFKHAPDLLIADVMMPRLDGLSLVKRLRSNSTIESLPIILVSARAGDEARLDALRVGADEYVVKPFVAGELLATVASRLEIARIRRDARESLIASDRELRASEQRFRRIFEGISLSIWEEDFSGVKEVIDRLLRSGVRDLRGHLQQHPELIDEAIRRVVVREVNPASLRLFGARDREELIQSLTHIFVPETRDIFLEEMLAIADGQPWFEAETMLQTLRGERIFVLFTITFPPSGEPYDRVLITITDITARKRAEETLRDSEERFRAMADNAPVMTWVTDERGYCTFLSRPWYEFTGQTPETGLGFGWLDAVHPDDRARSEELFRVSNAERSEFRIEYRVRRADGEYRWAIDSAAPRFDGRGAYLGYIGSVIDITERKLAEDALRDSAHALRDADRLKDEFLATLSHELRTPLTSILGWAQLLLHTHRDDDELRTGIESISRSARAQSSLIEDVLDISRITTGKMRLDRRPASLPAVIHAAMQTVRPAAEAKRLTLQTSIAPDMETVWIDPDRIQQVVWNLLSNAVKFTPPGGTVDVRAEASDETIVIEVRDTGPGVPAAFLPHIFERFRQADSSSRRLHSGLGLGLALTKDLVELHGGRITATSEEGKGACFRVVLPTLARSGAVAAEAIADVDDGRVLTGRRVLVVDDDDDARAIFSSILRQRGAEVASASSVNDALSMLDRFVPDVVVTDIAMPGRDGFELLAAIRAHAFHARLPVIAVTAKHLDPDVHLASPADFTHHLRKPLDLEELVATVRRFALPSA